MSTVTGADNQVRIGEACARLKSAPQPVHDRSLHRQGGEAMYFSGMQRCKRLDQARRLIVMSRLAVTKPPNDEWRFLIVDPGVQSFST
jgi:hypothetical protein